MDRETVEIYERWADQWDRLRPARRLDDATRLAATVPEGAVRADLGCGPGSYAGALGTPLVAVDASFAMLEIARRQAPHALLVQADLERPPLADGALAAAWANMSYLHLARHCLPLALARLHWAMRVGAALDMSMRQGADESRTPQSEDFGGRFFAGWDPDHLRDVVVGAGFEVERVDSRPPDLVVQARRSHSLPDTVGPAMGVLVCGLNPSEHAARRGVGFSRPGNRFWPAALAAGLVERPLDPLDALETHGVGMTDLVKRTTRRAAELRAEEFEGGMARLERMVRWLRPALVCFVGLQGWRAAVSPRAGEGLQSGALAGRDVYLMPSTSGANAGSSLASLTAHLVEVARLAGEREEH